MTCHHFSQLKWHHFMKWGVNGTLYFHLVKKEVFYSRVLHLNKEDIRNYVGLYNLRIFICHASQPNCYIFIANSVSLDEYTANISWVALSVLNFFFLHLFIQMQIFLNWLPSVMPSVKCQDYSGNKTDKVTALTERSLYSGRVVVEKWART